MLPNYHDLLFGKYYMKSLKEIVFGETCTFQLKIALT